MSSFFWPPQGSSGSSGVPIYANFAAFPSGSSAGDLAVAADTGDLYEWTGSAWQLIAAPGSAFTLGNLDAQAATAKGAALTGGALSMQSADGTHPGLINTTTQTIAGQKTFSTGLTGTLTGHASLDVATSSLGNLTDAGTDGIVVTGGTGAIVGSVSLAQHVSDSTHNGYLSSADWVTFNAKQAALTIGNLTDAGTDGITVTSGTGAVIGSGTSIAQHVADSTHNGYLSSADWVTFNAKQAALTLPLSIANGGTNQGSAYTAGSIIFSNGTSLVQDNTNLFWDDTNFTIGIGTASPSAASCMDVVTNTSKAVRISAYGTAAIPAYQGRAARGTSGSPTATQSGDSLAVLAGRGYGATGFVSAASTGSISFQSEANFTDSSMPTNINFNVTPSASTTVGTQMRLSAGGNLLLGTLTDSTTQKLQVIGNSKVGTVTSGTWNGDILGVTYGGTGQGSNWTADGVIYASSTTVLASTSAGTSGQVLTSNGAGVAPTFQPATGSASINFAAGLTSNYTTGANAAIKYDTVSFDTNSAYSTGTGNYTVPTTGKYRVSAIVDGQTACNVYLAINGTGYVYLVSVITNIANGYISGSVTVSVNATDTLAVFADAARTFSGKTGSLYQNYVSIEKVG